MSDYETNAKEKMRREFPTSMFMSRHELLKSPPAEAILAEAQIKWLMEHNAFFNREYPNAEYNRRDTKSYKDGNYEHRKN